ncbi:MULTISPECIES: hypothetical protein [unclassified Streptomyces]|nr:MULTISPECIES: hypothetical protein [unclassified Streptomyces]
MARAEHKAPRQALIKAALTGLGLTAFILAVCCSMTWLYAVGAALLATSVAIGLRRGSRKPPDI